MLASRMRNNFPKRPSGAPLHIFFTNYMNTDVPVGVVPRLCLRQCIALFAVAENWLLLESG